MTRFPSLSEALDVGRGDVVSFVGGGGKTSAILTLVTELRAAGVHVLVTTTTKIGRRLADALPVVWWATDPADGALRRLSESGAILLVAESTPDGKLAGPDPDALDALIDDLGQAVALIEADGARSLPIKAPAAHEPVVPRRTGIVVPMVGLDALGRPIEAGSVHRPDLLVQFGEKGVVTPELVVALLTSPVGGLKNVPPNAAVRPLLNKLDTAPEAVARKIAVDLLASAPPSVDRVVLAGVGCGAYRAVTRRSG